MATIYAQIAADADDAFEASDGGVSGSAVNAIFTGADQYWAGRFSLAIAQGATINKAFLAVYMQVSPGTPAGTVYASDEDNAGAFALTDYEISNETSTTATASFSWTNGLGTGFRLIDVTDIVQEIIDRGSWSSGNYIQMIIASATGCDFTIRQRDGTATSAAVLHVTHGETEPDIRLQIASSTDDSQEETAGTPNLTSPNGRLISGTPHNLLRFQSVAIPQYSTIDSATLKLFLYDTDYDTVEINIHADLTGDSATGTSTNGDITLERAKTLAYVLWDEANIIVSSQPAFYDGPEIKTVIQEIVDHQDWASGNDLSLLMRHLAGASKEFWYRTFDYCPGNAAMIEINYTAPASQPSEIPVWVPVIQSADDAEGREDVSMLLTQARVDMSDNNTDRMAGWRFQDVPVPQGATIAAAYWYGVFEDTAYDNPDCAIHADDTDDSAVFTDTVNDLHDRDLTTATVDWDVTGLYKGSTLNYTHSASPDLAAVIQEVVDRPGWAEGNSLSILMVSNGNTDGGCLGYDSDGLEQSAKLYIEYEPPKTGRPMRAGLERGLRAGLSI